MTQFAVPASAVHIATSRMQEQGCHLMSHLSPEPEVPDLSVIVKYETRQSRAVRLVFRGRCITGL